MHHHDVRLVRLRIGIVLGEAGIQIDDIGLRRPTLDDVFLKLTGHGAVENGSGEEAGEGVPS